MNEPLDQPEYNDYTEQEEIMIRQADFIYDRLKEDPEAIHQGRTLKELQILTGIDISDTKEAAKELTGRFVNLIRDKK